MGLILFGGYKFFRSRHPRWVGMQVSFKDLVAWSFLMASAHGAGLMLVPVLLGWSAGHADVHDASMHHDMSHAAGEHAEHASAFAAVGNTPFLALLATLVHTLGYLVVMGVIAVIIYEKVGLAILRKAWFNLDIVWAAALVITVVVTLII